MPRRLNSSVVQPSPSRSSLRRDAEHRLDLRGAAGVVEVIDLDPQRLRHLVGVGRDRRGEVDERHQPVDRVAVPVKKQRVFPGVLLDQ